MAECLRRLTEMAPFTQRIIIPSNNINNCFYIQTIYIFVVYSRYGYFCFFNVSMLYLWLFHAKRIKKPPKPLNIV